MFYKTEETNKLVKKDSKKLAEKLNSMTKSAVVTSTLTSESAQMKSEINKRPLRKAVKNHLYIGKQYQNLLKSRRVSKNENSKQPNPFSNKVLHAADFVTLMRNSDLSSSLCDMDVSNLRSMDVQDFDKKFKEDQAKIRATEGWETEKPNLALWAGLSEQNSMPSTSTSNDFDDSFEDSASI